MCAYAYMFVSWTSFTNYGVKFMPATENVLKKTHLIFFYDLEQFRLHANVVSLEDLLDQPTITHIVLHVSYSSIKSNFLPIVH